MSKAKSTKKKVIAKEPVSRLAVVTLSKDMPGGKKTTDHPLVWLVREKMGERNKSDLARHLDVRPGTGDSGLRMAIHAGAAPDA